MWHKCVVLQSYLTVFFGHVPSHTHTKKRGQYVLNFTLLKVISSDCFLSILCLQVAIKSIRKEKIKDEQDMVHIRREIEIMSSLRHPHIISIYEGERSAVSSGNPQTHTRDKSYTLDWLEHTKIKTHMSKNHPALSSFSTCGQSAGLSCYDMQMS